MNRLYPPRVTTYALVHGAWHDSSGWSRLTTELQALGHDTVAMDLPCDDPSATFSDYAEVVIEELRGHTEDLVLVGHSLAGHTIPLVATRRRVRALVYLCALVPIPGRSFVDQMREDPSMLIPGYEQGLEIDELGRRSWVDADLARSTFYGDCPDDVATAAVARLRPQSPAPYVEPCPLDALPDTASTYVVCQDDRLVRPAWSRRVAPERLGAAVVELPGGHSPFLSRPADLAGLLHALA